MTAGPLAGYNSLTQLECKSVPNDKNPKKNWWEHVADGVLKAVALYAVGFYISAAALAVHVCDPDAGIFPYIVMVVGLLLQLLGSAVLFFTLFGDSMAFNQTQRLKSCVKVLGFLLLIVPTMFALYDVLGTVEFFAQFDGCRGLQAQ